MTFLASGVASLTPSDRSAFSTTKKSKHATWVKKMMQTLLKRKLNFANGYYVNDLQK